MRRINNRATQVFCLCLMLFYAMDLVAQNPTISLYRNSTANEYRRTIAQTSFNPSAIQSLYAHTPFQETHQSQLFWPGAMAGIAQRDSQSIHSPRKATLLALTLPGAGQIYNRKYWKAPIVYAGLGGSIYAIGYFRNNMRTLNDSIAGLYRLGKTPNALLLQDRDNQRSRRDVAILCLAGVYALQVLDAVVDAHFYQFNINEKIGMKWNAAPSRMLAFHYQISQ